MTTAALRLRASVLGLALAILPAHGIAQEIHAGAAGFVFETVVRERTGDGVLRLANGASVLATAELAGAREGSAAVVVPLRSGCRIWIEDVGLSGCSLVQEIPEGAPRTAAALVWVERVVDAGATVVLTGGTAFAVGPDQVELTNTWPVGEAILIDGTRLLHLDAGTEIVRVARVR